ncbi:MAG TPA: OadG family protein [Anaerolineae bacterium]|nr:OadG family protein [Anaerolineae bacterium]HOR00850.1 OadG family protein [Anaerolineae bacterium]HPL29288.1 OadG family protein [Anaerolineae bacterium]
MSEFMQGISVTVVGMGLVFVSLGLLMFIIMGLMWLLRTRPQPAVAPASAGAAPFVLDPDPAEPAGNAEVSPEIVAAIAVALAAWQARRAGNRPPQTSVVTFAPGSPAWRASGRLS